MTLKHWIFIVALAVFVAGTYDAVAREFRTFTVIPAEAALPEGAVAVKKVLPIDRRAVDAAVRQLIASWKSRDIKKFLGEDFYDGDRLTDNIQSFIPRDAKLSLLAVQGQQTLQQYEIDGQRVSRLSVIISTQIEFNDPQSGFQRFPGRTELVFKVKQDL